MLLLALDTSSAVGVALLDGERLLAHEQHLDARRHGELLAPAVRSVLAAAGVDRRDLGGVAVGVGPAPFTGLRVGVVTALALGEALGVPVHGVSSLDALAASALAAAPASARGPLAGGFVVAADARRREVHWARVAVDDASDALAGWRRTAGPDVSAPGDVAAEGLPAVGRGAALYRGALPGPDVLAGATGESQDAVVLPLDPDPGVLGALVARRLATGGELLPARPLYLRRPDAQVPASSPGGEPPVTPPVSPPAGGAVLRRMRWWDVEPLLPVEAALFGASAWSAELFWSELAAPDRTYLVAEDAAGALLGYAGLALAGPDADVQTLAVAPHAQRRGVGGVLLDALVTRARAAGASALLLEVRADNAPAQALYAARGFERIGVRRRYYQPEDVDALVLRLRLTGADGGGERS